MSDDHNVTRYPEALDGRDSPRSANAGNGHSSADLPIVFVLGTGRCGSSLLQEVLARHPHAAFLSNVDDRVGTLGRHNRRLYAAVPPTWTRKGRVRFAPSEGYRLLDRNVSPMLSRSVRDLTASDVTPWLRRRLARVFTDRFTAQGGQVFLHKFTGWPRAALLKEVFPAARFVHVVRDGRAVANSLLQMAWWRGYGGPPCWRLGPLPPEYQGLWEIHDRSFVVLAGLYWRILMEAHETAQRAIVNRDDVWMTVRYEDLIAEPNDVLASTLAWLGLEPHPAFAGQIAAHPFRSSRATAFHSDLSVRQVAQLEDAIAPVLMRYGYLESASGPTLSSRQSPSAEHGSTCQRRTEGSQ